jgi:hypothetical protein
MVIVRSPEEKAPLSKETPFTAPATKSPWRAWLVTEWGAVSWFLTMTVAPAGTTRLSGLNVKFGDGDDELAGDRIQNAGAGVAQDSDRVQARGHLIVVVVVAAGAPEHPRQQHDRPDAKSLLHDDLLLDGRTDSERRHSNPVVAARNRCSHQAQRKTTTVLNQRRSEGRPEGVARARRGRAGRRAGQPLRLSAMRSCTPSNNQVAATPGTLARRPPLATAARAALGELFRLGVLALCGPFGPQV